MEAEMKTNQRQAQWIASVLIVILSASFALPTVAQEEEEEEQPPQETKLASDLSEQLEQLDKTSGELAKAEDSRDISLGLGEQLDWLGSLESEIEEYFDAKGETKTVGAAEKLGSAIKDAQEALEAYEPGKDQKELMAALEQVQELGEDVVGLISPNT